MKKAGWVFVAVIIITLMGGMIYKTLNSKDGYIRTEFLFDTECSVRIYGKNAEKVATEVFDELEKINHSTNMYSTSSEVSVINNSLAGVEIEVSPEIIKMLKVADEISNETEGAFDLTVASVTEIWDFKGQNPSVPKEKEIAERRERINYKDIIINEEKNTIVKAYSETKIDLGGIAKGYAADAIAEILKRNDVKGAIIDLGGNVVCVGENPNAKDGLWKVGIQVPFRPTGEYEEIVKLKEGAVVTSGIYQRYFEEDGKIYHHIINPKTGYPTEKDYSSVTIVSDSALVADCLATACFVIGEEKGSALAEKYDADIFYQ